MDQIKSLGKVSHLRHLIHEMKPNIMYILILGLVYPYADRHISINFQNTFQVFWLFLAIFGYLKRAYLVILILNLPKIEK